MFARWLVLFERSDRANELPVGVSDTGSMRKQLLAGMMLIVFGGASDAAPMTKIEREQLVAHLEMTERWLGLELRGLSEAQLKWRAGEGKWSILDVLDHLTVAEPQYWQWLGRG